MKKTLIILGCCVALLLLLLGAALLLSGCLSLGTSALTEEAPYYS